MEKIKVNTDAAEFKVIENSKDEPSLEQAQKFVGGYVEGITFPNGDYLIINEEGKLQNLPLNPEATLFLATPNLDFSSCLPCLVMCFLCLLAQ
jgi:hypothetical protein